MRLPDHEIRIEKMQKAFLELLRNDIQEMLSLFSVTPKKYSCFFDLLDKTQAKSDWRLRDYWYKLVLGWITLLRQFVPLEKFRVEIKSELNLTTDQQQSLELLVRKLSLGQNINNMSLKFLPQLKRIDEIDMLSEQSRIKHFHLPVKGKKQDKVLFIECDCIEKKICIHGLAGHAAMENFSVYNEYFDNTAIRMNSLPPSKEAEFSKKEERKVREKGWIPIVVNEEGTRIMRKPLNFRVGELIVSIYRDIVNNTDDNTLTLFEHWKKQVLINF